MPRRTSTIALPNAVTALSAEDRLAALARPDKWFLSGGDGFVWAPPHPLWLHRPGLWDEAHFYHYRFGPLFAVALVEPDGREVPLTLAHREWRPDRLLLRWAATDTTLIEERFLLPGGRFRSAWRPASGRTWAETAHADRFLVGFTSQPGPMVARAGMTSGGVEWERRLEDRNAQRLSVRAALTLNSGPGTGLDPDGGEGAGAPRVTRGGLRSEGSVAIPEWAQTPFPELWGPSHGLPDAVRLDGITPIGRVHLAAAVPLDSAGSEVLIELHLAPADAAPRRRPTHEAAPSVGRAGLRRAAATEHWASFLDAFPTFRCSDPYLSRYYDYRLYGLCLNRLEGGIGNVPHPAIAEGIGYFHLPIAYSAPCHMRETRWSADPALAHGSLLNFLDAQNDDGSFPGRLYVNHRVGEDFYHANWGDAVLAVDAVHPNRAFLARAGEGLARYARWLDTARDPDGTGIYTVVNHYETGQEYMSRYVAVNPEADLDEWTPTLRLGAIDVTVYAYRLKRALSAIARRLDRPDESAAWSDGAERIGRAIRERMWDERTGLFSDVDLRTGERTGVKAAVCFYPLFTDLLTAEMLGRMLAHLEDPAEFATPFPVPSTSRDDPLFSATAEWKGKRHSCPWNGRVWPMTNSHILEGLLQQWHRGRREVEETAASLLTRWVRMMFHDGDRNRPNCYEHYNPMTGQASIYRGIDDYQHSWVLDLILRSVCGLEPLHGGLRVDPLPLPLHEARLENCRISGHDLSVIRRNDRLEVRVDGEAHTTEIGRPLELAL